jgi:two-component system aerobic respiration control sensor histidine kinase ArcB
MDVTDGDVTVLCVGDGTEVVAAAATVLDGRGFAVTTASGAREALARLPGDVDCVVTASDLPDDDGVTFLRAVREADPDVPVFLLAPDGSESLASTAIRAGVTEYLGSDAVGDGTVPALADRVERAVERARAARERREKSQQLDAVLADMPVSMYFKDDQARHVRVSVAHATGYGDADPPEGKTGVTIDDPADFVGKTDYELFPSDNGREAYEDDLRVIETGESIRNKEEHIHVEDGEDRWVTTTKTPWRDDSGEIQGLFGFTLDVTDLKRRERELTRQNERLNEFANIVSHDLRNPLNVAKRRLDLAAEECDSDHLDRAASAHDRMDRLISDILALARQGETVTDPEPVSLATVAEECWTTVETAGATLELADRPVIYADRSRLRQALENLVRNAIEHGDGDVTITIGGLPGGFYVADDGPGIPDDERERVFESGYTTDPEGTGFGLDIVNDIATAHDWTIELTDSENGGARFEIRGVTFADDVPGADGA